MLRILWEERNMGITSMHVADRGDPSFLKRTKILDALQEKDTSGHNIVRFWEDTSFVKAKLESRISLEGLEGVEGLVQFCTKFWTQDHKSVGIVPTSELPTPPWDQIKTCSAKEARTTQAWNITYKSLKISTHRPYLVYDPESTPTRPKAMGSAITDNTWYAMERDAVYNETPLFWMLREAYTTAINNIPVIPGQPACLSFRFWDDLPKTIGKMPKSIKQDIHASLAILQKKQDVEKQMQDFTSAIKIITSSPLNSINVDGTTKLKKNIKDILVSLVRVSCFIRL